MPTPIKPEATLETALPDPYPPYRPIYGWVFQSWLIMFLAVICLALIFYLYPHIRALVVRLFT